MLRITTMLLDGQRTVVEVPEGGQVAPPVRSSVLIAAGVELEVNAGTAEAAESFVSSTGSTLQGSTDLPSGLTLRTGSLGGGDGTAYLLEMSPEPLYGPAPPGLPLADLAALIQAAAPAQTRLGPRLDPQPPVAWSPHRSHDLVLPLELPTGEGYVLDVRRALSTDPAQLTQGAEVEGGWLSRSEPGDNRHLVLQTTDYVVYGIPLPGTDIDELTTVMTEVRVRAG